MIILPSVIVPKRLDPYYQANTARRDLVILREEKQQNDSRNTVFIISRLFSLLPSRLLSPPPSRPPSPLPSQLPSSLLSRLPSPPPSPEPVESKIPAKHLGHEPKVLDLPDLTEPKPST
jgi:hypothetical protein